MVLRTGAELRAELAECRRIGAEMRRQEYEERQRREAERAEIRAKAEQAVEGAGW